MDLRSVARPLVIGEAKHKVEYARFRLQQIMAHIQTHRPDPSHRFYNECRTEVFQLLHILRLHGQITREEEQSYLSVSVSTP